MIPTFFQCTFISIKSFEVSILKIIYIAQVYAALIFASLLIMSVPFYLRRPVSLIVFLGLMLFCYYLIEPVKGMEWFVPTLYLKLLVAHLVTEEPYRPVQKK